MLIRSVLKFCNTLIHQAPTALLICPLLLVLSSACVTPPHVSDAQVIDNQELKLISLIQRGKDYASAGRTDLAELQYRKAIKLNPKVSSVYNDLGFVLQLQDRLDEAQSFYLQALKIEPKNLVARENLARVLYARGEVESSIREFENLIELQDLLPISKIRASTGKEYSAADIRGVYRSLAVAYYQDGRFDEATCYSLKALQTGGVDFGEVGQHERLLMSLEKVSTVVPYLRDVILVWQDAVPARILLDYGIALYLQQDFSLAKESFSRMMSAKDVEQLERRDARLIRLLIAKQENNQGDVIEIKKELTDEDSTLCKSSVVDRDNYWPLKLVKEVETLFNTLCTEEVSS